MVPSKQLLDLLSERFSEDFLNRLEQALADLPTLSDNGRVAVYVARKVCSSVSSMMDTVEPYAARHDAIETHLREPLGVVVARLAKFQDVPLEELAALIQASEKARITT